MMKNIFFLFLFLLFTTGVNSFAQTSDDCRGLLIRNLAETIVDKTDAGDGVDINSDMLIEFFTQNISPCKEYLIKRNSSEDIVVDEDYLGMDVNWEYIRSEIAAKLTIDSGSKQFFVCENHRSIQMGIEVALWTATAVSAVFSFGTGGVAVQAGKTALVEGAKATVKISIRKGAVSAAKSAVAKATVEATAKKLGSDLVAKKAASEAAKIAAKDAATKIATDASIAIAKSNLKAAGKNATKKAIELELKNIVAAGGANAASAQAGLSLLLDNTAKRAAMAAAGRALVAEQAIASKALSKALATFAISTPIAAAGGLGSAYAYLESGFDPKMMNCTNIDEDNGCYTGCKEATIGSPNDDLNSKVFKPIFGKNLCVDEDANYSLREIKSGGLPTVGDIFISNDEAKWEKARQMIESNVKDKDNCDYNEDDVDMYIGAPFYSPETLEPSTDGTALIITGIRLDD